MQKHDGGKICDTCLSEISFNDNFHKINIKGIEGTFATYYKGSIKELIYNFKVHKNFSSGEYLGEILKDFIVKNNFKIDYLTYVPRDKSKIKLEGFDQSYFIVKFLGKHLNLKVIKLLECKGKTLEQKKMKSSERKSNVKNKFFPLKCKLDLEGKEILIIDDVATTCSTLEEVISVIKKTNPKTMVSVLTIAKTLI